MSEESKPSAPFITLGKHLRYLREQSKESVAEVSGAVEIDEPVLARIEAGIERPSEDILLLLINHFGMPNQEAIQLWELAGYDGDMPEQLKPNEDLHNSAKNVVMFLAVDMRTVYTDGLEINASKAGLTLTFTQTAAQDKSIPVARLGMSCEHAEQIIKQIQRALVKQHYNPGPKALPPHSEDPKDHSK